MSRPPVLFHVVPSLKRRGCEIFAAELVQGLAERGVVQSVCVVDADGAELSLQAGAWTYETLGVGNRWRKCWRLWALVRRQRPDCIMVHGGDSAKLLLPILVLGRRPPLVLRKIGLTAGWIPNPRNWRWPIYGWLHRHFDRVIVLGPAMRQEAVNRLGCREERVITLPNYRDTRPYQDDGAWRADRPRRAGCVRLVSIGALEPEKNHALMVEALAELSSSLPELRLRLIGDGSQKEPLTELAQARGVAEKVEFSGHCDDVAGQLADADILLLCSHTEGVPGVLIEAGLAGLPAVCWVVGDVEAVVDRTTARLTPAGDAGAFKAAVDDLVRDPAERQRLGARARERCLALFERGRVMEAYVRVVTPFLALASPTKINPEQ